MSTAVAEAIDDFKSLTTLNVQNATAVLERGLAALKAGQTVFDLRYVLTVDSAAVSVLLAWEKAAQDAGLKLELKNLPPALQSLTKLYGVCSLLFPTSVQLEPGEAAPANPQHEEFHAVTGQPDTAKLKVGADPEAAQHHH
ncbi:lipid asymmetry maintenance protein MlaB [Pseudoduganella danionis]|uniref:STAS domain-containing protein n=1 Tax=Pseudoduganella danionis TaxID=1890295 RepID=UPI0035AFDD67